MQLGVKERDPRFSINPVTSMAPVFSGSPSGRRYRAGGAGGSTDMEGKESHEGCKAGREKRCFRLLPLHWFMSPVWFDECHLVPGLAVSPWTPDRATLCVWSRGNSVLKLTSSKTKEKKKS